MKFIVLIIRNKIFDLKIKFMRIKHTCACEIPGIFIFWITIRNKIYDPKIKQNLWSECVNQRRFNNPFSSEINTHMCVRSQVYLYFATLSLYPFFLIIIKFGLIQAQITIVKPFTRDGKMLSWPLSFFWKI